MVEQQLRIAVVGAGFIGEMHAGILHDYHRANLVAIVDTNVEKAERLGVKFDCNWYTDFELMLKSETLDAVDICTSDEYHVEPCILAAKYKKDILLEKPMGRTTEEVKEINRVVSSAGVRLMINHILHFDPRYITLLETVNSGKLGEIVSMLFRRVNWKRTPRRLMGKVSFFYYMCVHDIELMLCCNPEKKPTKVYTQSASIINREINQQDVAFTTITFEDGSICCLEVMWGMPDNTATWFRTSAEILGTKGICTLNGNDGGVEVATDMDVVYPDMFSWPQHFGKTQGALKESVRHFVDQTLDKQAYEVSLRHSGNAIRIIDAMFESMKEGCPITILEWD